MAQLTITIPDAQVQRVLDAFEGIYGEPLPGETNQEFARRTIISFVRGVVVRFESGLAEDQAAQDVVNQVTIT